MYAGGRGLLTPPATGHSDRPLKSAFQQMHPAEITSEERMPMVPLIGTPSAGGPHPHVALVEIHPSRVNREVSSNSSDCDKA